MIKTRYQKICLLWLIVASICMICMSFAYYGGNSIAAKGLMSLSSISMILSLLIYNRKVHLSLELIFLSEGFGLLASLVSASKETTSSIGIIPIEFWLGFICALSGIYLIVKEVVQKKDKITFRSIFKTEIKPFKTNNLARLIILIAIVNIIFIMTNNYKTYEPYITWLSMTYTLMPSIIILISIFPTDMVQYIRIAYYVIWMYIIEMGVTVNKISQVNLIEPIIYIITVLIGSTIIREKMQLNKKEAQLNEQIIQLTNEIAQSGKEKEKEKENDENITDKSSDNKGEADDKK